MDRPCYRGASQHLISGKAVPDDQNYGILPIKGPGRL